MSWIPIIVTLILYVFVYSAVIRKGRGKKRGIGEHVSSDFSSKTVSVKRVDRNKAAYTKKYCPNNEPITENSPTTNPVEPTSTNDQVYSVSATMSLGVTNQAYNEETEDDDNHSNNHGASTKPTSEETRTTLNQLKLPVVKRLQFSRNSSKREGYLAGIRATRTLTYILICMVTSGLPWSVAALVAYINPSLTVHISTSMVRMTTKYLFKIIFVRLHITRRKYILYVRAHRPTVLNVICNEKNDIYSSKKETQNHIKKRNAKPHIGDIGKIILIAVW